MKLPAYPRTKPSGLDWLGEVPEHWSVKRSDGIIESEKRQVSPEVFADEEVFHYSIPAVQEFGTGLVENGESIASAKQAVTEPVVLVSRLNPRKATICSAEPKKQRTLASTEFVALKARKCDLRFLEYLVSTELFRQRLDSWVQSVTRSHQRASPELIYRFWSAWPDPAEQRAIAAFLDRETGRGDRLVAKKRELIERLKEKRTALISRTVTKGLPAEAAAKAGLNPHPKLQPSGIEWLGDIPEHWHVMRLRLSTAQIGDGLHGTPDYVDDSGIYFVNGNNLVAGTVTVFENTRQISEQTYLTHKLPLGDGTVLMSINGTIGNLAVYGGEEIMLGKSAAFINCDSSLDRRFLMKYLESEGSQSFFDLELTGTTIFNLSLESIRRMPLARPPLAEQRAIADYLDREMSKLDQMMKKVEAAIEKLQEYRTALITAAVTGKIDVRSNV